MLKQLPIAFLICTVIANSCAPPGSNSPKTEEPVAADTASLTLVAQHETAHVDSAVVASPPKGPPLVLSDSSSSALNDLVSAQFERVYKELADSANYYKVSMADYFDEYEGQNEIWFTTWYFDKAFSIVYARHTDQTGGMERPYVTEYIIREGSIVCVKEDSDDSGKAYERTVVLWDRQAGCVRMGIKSYGNPVISKEPMVANYAATTQKSWEVNLSTLKQTLEKGGDQDPVSDTYSIRIEEPKPSELLDYTEVTIPKPVYDKLMREEK